MTIVGIFNMNGIDAFVNIAIYYMLLHYESDIL